MPDIFDEVDQDLRADRARALWRRYGVLVIAAAVLVVVGVAGWEAWTWQQDRAAARAATEYIAATATPIAPGTDGHAARQASVARLRDIVTKAPAGYRTLARLRVAGLLADDGDLAGADTEWDAVAADGAAPQSLRDLANLEWARHAVDAGDPAAVTARLRPLAGPQAPFHPLALETLALLSLRENKPDAARDTLRQIAADPATSPGLRGRTGKLLEQLGDPPLRDDVAPHAGPAS